MCKKIEIVINLILICLLKSNPSYTLLFQLQVLIQESKMSFSSDITFNNTIATISFPTKLNNSNDINWTLSIKSGTHMISTTGSVPIEPSSSTPVTINPITSLPAPITSWPASITNPANKEIHTAFIKEGLKTVANARGRDAKATAAKMLYDYMLMCAIDFVLAHERLKHTVIDKAYELKNEASDQTEMITSLNNVLTALSAPLEKVTPLSRQVACGGSLIYCGCNSCPDLTVKPTESTPIETTESTPIETTESTTIPNDSTEDANTEYLLFVTMARRMGCDYIVRNSKTYYRVYKETIERGFIKSNNSAEMIEYYLNRWGRTNDTYQRISLMKCLFAKNKLTFTDDVMSLYDIWQQTYKPTGKTNRFIKMCVFINTQKALFNSS